MTMTPTENVTDERISTLREHAAKAGDLLMCAICDVALGHRQTDGVLDDWERGKLALFATRDSARAECARVIADLEAQGYEPRTYAELREWARTVSPGAYLVTYDESGGDDDDDPDNSRCGYDDATHDQIAKWLGERGLRLDTDDMGLIVRRRVDADAQGDLIEIQLGTPNGPRIEYGPHDDGAEVDAIAHAEGWAVDWSTPAYKLASGRLRSPLVKP